VASGAADKPQPALIVFAAVSTTSALEDVGAAFTKESGLPVRFTVAAGSTLAKMIEAGVPADVFVSADTGWMNYLRAHNAIKPASERNLLVNDPVLVAPMRSAISLKIKPHFELRAALDGKRLAIADPVSVPAGRYARAALMTLGIWSDVVLTPRTVGVSGTWRFGQSLSSDMSLMRSCSLFTRRANRRKQSLE